MIQIQKLILIMILLLIKHKEDEGSFEDISEEMIKNED